MKSLRQYLVETEVKQDIPQQGDAFAIELEDGTLLETYIMSVDNDTILLDATPKIIGVLREWADLDGEAGEVLFEGQFKQSMLTAAERMELEDFVDRFGHLFSPGEAEKFWHNVNGVEHNEVDESDYDTEIDVVDRGEYDREGDMAKDDLATIIRAARKLAGMLGDDENMPEWVQSKITKAADYVDTAADYIESNKEQGVAEGEMDEAKYQGREVKLGKPTRGDVKKFKVYVRDPSTGNIKKVNFGHGGTSAKRAGQKTMKIKKSNPARRRSFRARHNCDNPGPRTKARYWSCRAW